MFLMLLTHPALYDRLVRCSHHLKLDGKHFRGKKYLNKTREAKGHILKNTEIRLHKIGKNIPWQTKVFLPYSVLGRLQTKMLYLDPNDVLQKRCGKLKKKRNHTKKSPKMITGQGNQSVRKAWVSRLWWKPLNAERLLQRGKKESVIHVPGESGQEETHLNYNRKIYIRHLDFFSLKWRQQSTSTDFLKRSNMNRNLRKLSIAKHTELIPPLRNKITS